MAVEVRAIVRLKDEYTSYNIDLLAIVYTFVYNGIRAAFPV